MAGGRPLGSKNGTTAKAKAAIEECFMMLGGVEAFYEWAKDNRTDFYKVIFPKLVPLKLTGDPDNPIVINEIRRTIIDATPRLSS